MKKIEKIFLSFKKSGGGGEGYVESIWRPVSTGDTLAGPGAGIVASFLVPKDTDFVLSGGWRGRLFFGWWKLQLLLVFLSLLFICGQCC